MKYLILFVTLGIFLLGCNEKPKSKIFDRINWKNREVVNLKMDDLHKNRTYLPVYSHIYHRYDDQVFDLTITVSIRNTSMVDSFYILKADYYDTHGENIRQYITNPVVVEPMETLEIVITEDDKAGGSGANFIFDWAASNNKKIPLFEAVMISTHGQQGLSFSTRGILLNE